MVVDCRKPCLRCRDQQNQPNLPVWAHRSCHNILSWSYERCQGPAPTIQELEKLEQMTHPRFKTWRQPDTNEIVMLEGLFSLQTELILRGTFSQDLLRRLPAELLSMVIAYIASCPYLTVLGQGRRLIDILRSREKAKNVQIDLSRPVYISKVVIWGMQYISRMSNTPDPFLPNVELPHDGPKPEPLILLMDPRGIRNIGFGNQSSIHHPIASSLLYQVFRREHFPPKFTIQGLSDVGCPH